MADDQRQQRDRPERPDRSADRDPRTGRAAAAERMGRQQEYVDQQIRLAMERGEFDDLPGAGKPLDLGAPHDADWWLKRLIERERITGVLPPALQLRKDDAELADHLDRETSEKVVRELVEDFNRRVVEARRQLQGGPPVITRTRDVEQEVGAWRDRRRARRAATAADPARSQTQRDPEQGTPARPRRWWRRRP